MDWSKAKTIFIFTFLCLNLFLGYQLNEKQTASDLNLRAEATLQERLLEENINLSIDVKDEQLVGTYISGSFDKFLQDIDLRKKANIQRAEFGNNKVHIWLDQPMPFQGDKQLAEKFVQEQVINGTEYRFAHFDIETKQIAFFQTFEGKRIDNYEGKQYHLVLEVDRDDNIIGYHQSYLTVVPEGREQEMISALKAIEILLDEPLIPPDSEITRLELSYISLFKPLGEIQVFAPMWNIGVNDDMFYVDAIGGVIQNIH